MRQYQRFLPRELCHEYCHRSVGIPSANETRDQPAGTQEAEDRSWRDVVFGSVVSGSRCLTVWSC